MNARLKQFHYIYTIYDKRNGDVIYVGRTINTERRWRSHYDAALRGTHSNKLLSERILALDKRRSLGFKVVDRFWGTAWDAEEVELGWMHGYKKEGHPLTNLRYSRWAKKPRPGYGKRLLDLFKLIRWTYNYLR